MTLIRELFVWRSGASDNTGWEAGTPVDFYFDQITVSSSPVTSVRELSSVNLSVSPNPATDVVSVNGVTNLNALVLSVTGQVMKSVDQSGNQLSVSELPKGMYFLSGKSEGKPYILKFIKK